MGEEKPGLLNSILEGLTSLHLRGWSMLCSDIASPNLRCLTVIILDRSEHGLLPGMDGSMHGAQQRQQADPIDLRGALCGCMQWAIVPSSRRCMTMHGTQQRRISGTM